ncbi:MAG TPA: type II toxin-antitoxin system RelE/ParE family toxin [Steroidobacteraceae bacterium]|nr:type II toxin-antitoxin system RelE/ParE family toxin [Steroidobacteraceae bacterium]
MKYEFHPEAEQELYEAASRYEAEVSELGVRFADEVERVIQLLLEHPELGSRLDDDLRHFVLRKFPFSVVYAVVSDIVSIVAVAHGSREPGYWRWRVQDR